MGLGGLDGNQIKHERRTGRRSPPPLPLLSSISPVLLPKEREKESLPSILLPNSLSQSPISRSLLGVLSFSRRRLGEGVPPLSLSYPSPE